MKNLSKRSKIISRTGYFAIAYLAAILLFITMEGVTTQNLPLLLWQASAVLVGLDIMRTQERVKGRNRNNIHMSDDKLESLRRKEV